MKLISKASALTMIALLSGCASTFESVDTAMKNSTSFKNYDLSATDHSDAMQVMHLTSRRAVANANNIDEFTKQNHNTFLSVTQGATVAGAAIGTINPFQMATRLIGLQATKSSIAQQYRTNTLISIVPVADSTDRKEIEAKIAAYQQKQLSVAKDAYEKAGFSTKTIQSGVDVAWSRLFPRTAVVPMNTALNQTELCFNPNVFMETKDQTAFDASIVECYAITNPITHLYVDNNLSNSEVLPNSNSFIVVSTVLPDVFPVKDMKIDKKYEGVLFYQPTFYWLSSQNMKDFASTDMDRLLEYWKEGMFSYEPLLTDLGNGEVHKFGQ
ncbi:hypothetical protein IB292_01730 [Vibrio parahaemolyticus]|uniref:Lipoprotein n=2 Tax=Vibrio harveyi group TaxID=717610 RepID=A0A9Q3UC07_VIBPH|nr:hypothetical protein [Vibrio parahaemolyticus]MCC3803746.1 hypothetical protein [Vibrio parahaemolyticus]CAH1598722.1 conserved exported hypothetical protein [Vibrio jasicida]CAH1601613.1 conserved exported hypothetical protein [Vibrio jasicida]